MSGEFIAECLRRAGIQAIFAVPGVPITETLNVIRNKAYTYVAILRNEQAASQAAAAYGYHCGGSSLQPYEDAILEAMGPRRPRHADQIPTAEWGKISSQEQAPSDLSDLRPLETEETLRTILKYQPVHPCPGVCVTTCGPAFLNALSGVGTAHTNKWPLILISSSNGKVGDPHFLAAFQEYPQIKIAEGLKAAGTLKDVIVVKHTSEFPSALFRAVSCALSDVPGPVYLDVHWSVWRDTQVDQSLFLTLTRPDSVDINVVPVDENAWATKGILEDFASSIRPLLILGDELNYAMGPMARYLIRKSRMYLRAPIITTPMAKGLVCDDDDRSAAAARSMAMKHSDIVVVIGADLNWQFDNSSEWLNNKRVVFILSSRPQCIEYRGKSESCRPIAGHVTALFLRFLQGVSRMDEKPKHEEWCAKIKAQSDSSTERLKKRTEEETYEEISIDDVGRRWKGGLRLNYCLSKIVAPLQETVADDFHDILPKTRLLLSLWLGADSISSSLTTFICEGATCMDRSRLFIPSTCAKVRMDAAQFGAMGIGAGFAIGSAVWKQVFFDNARDILADLDLSPHLGPFIAHIKKRSNVYLVQGDSAFGFSGLEFETIRRYNLPIAICVLDNGGMYAMEAETHPSSRPRDTWDASNCLRNISVTDLTPDFKFTELGRAAGLPVETISRPWDHRIATKLPCLIHFILDPFDGSQQGVIKGM